MKLKKGAGGRSISESEPYGGSGGNCGFALFPLPFLIALFSGVGSGRTV